MTEKGRDKKDVCGTQEQGEPSTHIAYVLETNKGTQRAGASIRFLYKVQDKGQPDLRDRSDK